MNAILKQIKNTLVQFSRTQPITLQSATALILCPVTYYGIGKAQSDLVALIISGSIFTIVCFLLCYTLAARIAISQKIKATLHFDDRNLFSKRPIPCGIVLTDFFIPPFLRITIKRKFLQPAPFSPIHLIAGSTAAGAKRHLIDSIIFPHRGLWQIAGIEYQVKDALGFACSSWFSATEAAVEISAPPMSIKPLPIVASSARSGDEITQTRERSGDLFDIKQYDPSDGIKRILWKTYARSGALVVRRPEPAMIPEGEVAIFLVADKTEDYVAGAAQDYIRQLITNDITILFGTDGAGLEDSSTNPGKTLIAPSEAQILHRINLSVWSKDNGTGKNFGNFIQDLTLNNKIVQRVIVFGANRRDWYEKLTKEMPNQQVLLTIAIVPKENETSATQEDHLSSLVIKGQNEALICEAYRG